MIKSKHCAAGLMFLFMAAAVARAGDCSRGNCDNGSGTMIWADGSEYTGEWRNGTRHGRGEYRSAEGETYEGHWRNGLMHGLGTLTRADASRYEGQWMNGRRHGKGRSTLPSAKTNTPLPCIRPSFQPPE